MNKLTDNERDALGLIMKDLQLLFEKEKISNEEISEIVNQLESEETKSYINSLKEAKPETALSDAFFAGRSLLKKYLFGAAIPEAVIGEGFIDFKVKVPGDKIILVELKPLFEPKTVRVKAGRELKSLKQLKLDPQKHKEQILKYIHEGGEYIILTNLKEWFFFSRSVTAAEFEPFASTDLITFCKDFEVERDIWDYLTRLDQQSIREDLDALFFRSLQMWVGKLSEVALNVDDTKKTELLINLINKFIFIQTLDDYRVIEPRWIQETWSQKERRWRTKGKEQVLREFFKEVDNWFYQFYDTELFRDKILNYVVKNKQNFDLLHKNLRLILGLEYWMSALGGFRGVIQYNFRYIDEDILGKAYETYLAGVRHDEGIYYTPKFVTQHIVDNTLGVKLDEIVRKIKESLEKENFEEVTGLLAELISIKVLDPACGSGSFLIKAVRKIMERYKKVQNLLKDTERRHNKWQGSLYRPKSVEENVEKIHQIMEILGPQNDRELISRILVRHIHGNDKDKKALDVAKVNIWLEAIKLAPAEFRYDKLPADTNYILPDLQMNFCNGDSVVGLPEDMTVKYLSDKHGNSISEIWKSRKKYLDDPSDPKLIQQIVDIKKKLGKKLDEQFKDYLIKKKLPIEILKETKPFHWALDFWYFFFNKDGTPLNEADRGVDIVIGNPPYERIQVLKKKSPVYVDFLNKSFKSAHMNYDLAIIFTEKGYNLLKVMGNFGFIMTKKWMDTAYGKKLKALLKENKAIYQLIDFGHQQIFEGATTYTMLLFISKTPKNKFKTGYVRKLERTSDFLYTLTNSPVKEDDKFIIQTIGYEDLIPEKPWVFSFSWKKKATISANKLPCLEDNATLFVGTQTSADKVYIMEVKKQQGRHLQVFSRSTNKNHLIEKDILVPVLKGEDIKRWVIPETKRVVLFPYKIRGEMESEKHAKLIDANELEMKFPKAWKYLLENKAILEDRENERLKGQPKWYGYIYKKNLKKFSIPKIIVQEISSSATYFLDRKGKFQFVCGDAVGIIPNEGIDILLLGGILNSALLDWELKTRSTVFRGGYNRYSRRYISKLPIKLPRNPKEKRICREIIDLVRQILLFSEARSKIIQIWREWSTRLKGKETTLMKILESDLQKMKLGDFQKIWTKEASFYTMSKDTEASQKTFIKFKTQGDLDSKTLKIYGLDEKNQEDLVYEMSFNNENLMSHVFLSIMDLLESRRKLKTLKTILLLTEVPIITPNPVENTSNIMTKVREEFLRWKTAEGINNIPSNPLSIFNKLDDIEAILESQVFRLYGLDKNQVSTVLDSLAFSSLRQDKILRHFDENTAHVN